MMRSKLALLSLIFLLMPGFAFAQSGIVEGIVVGPDELPVPGANVVLEGTSYGAASDVEGRFSFSAPAGEYTLVVSFIGYAEYTAPLTIIGGQTQELEVQLEEGAVDLDEIVVTALGIVREERSLGYATQEVESDVVQRAQESNVVNALAGKVAGLQVTSSSGQPGKASRLTIRGNSSFLGNNQPLFVIDGVPVSNAEDDNPLESSVFTGGAANRLVDLDPNIIEDITVLKGASATALYGSRAANGAVVITTKGGRAGLMQQGGPRITFSSTARWDDAIIDGFQTEYLQGYHGCYRSGLPEDRGGVVDRECYTNYFIDQYQDLVGSAFPDQAALVAYAEQQAAGVGPQTSISWGPHIDSLNANQALLDQMGVDQVPVYNPREDFYQTGLVTENSLNIAGGAMGGNYFLSGSYLGQEGIVPGTNLNRMSVLAKYGASLTDRFDVESSINFVRTNNDWVNEGNGNDAYLYNLNFAPINFDITQTVWDDTKEQRTWWDGRYNNPLWLVDNNRYSSKVNRFTGNVSLSYELLPWLTLSERAGLDTYTDTRDAQIAVGTVGLYSDGALYDQVITNSEANSDLTLRAEKDLSTTIGLSGLVGYNVNYQDYEYNYLFGRGLTIPGFYDIQNASGLKDGNQYMEERLLHGVYGQGTFDYDSWAYLTLTARNDWSSTLPADNNSYFYPSASLGIVFTEATNLFGNTPLSFGKIRASIAQVGNDAPVYSLSTPFVQVTPGDGVRGDIIFPFNGVNAFQKDNVLGSNELKPEITTEYEAGLDLRFFGQRIRFDGSYYDRSTKNQIFNVPVSAATGYPVFLMNAGELRNRGVELSLGLSPIQTRDFAWNIQGNWSKNKTEVVELAPEVDNIFLYGFTSAQIRIQQGEDGYGVIWANRYERADPEVHEDLFAENPEIEEGMLLIGEDGLPRVANDLGAIGNVQPDWLANLRSTLTYKGLSLSGLLDIRRGGDVFNMDLYYSTFYGTAEITGQRGTPFTYEGFNVDTGEMNDVEIIRDENYWMNDFSYVRENFVEDGSFIKLRELSLSYTLPRRLIGNFGAEGLTLTATGRNLWTESDFSYGDPEGSLGGAGNGQGFYHMVTPGTKSYSLSLRLTM